MIRVLVAEDHTIVREGIKQLIGLAKHLVVAGEACNGEQLLETLRHTPCEVVLLDISMPGVNGLEAIPRIRALSNPPAVLVLSMHDEAQMAARALKIGAAGYATKDSDPALLLTATGFGLAASRVCGDAATHQRLAGQLALLPQLRPVLLRLDPEAARVLQQLRAPGRKPGAMSWPIGQRCFARPARLAMPRSADCRWSKLANAASSATEKSPRPV